MMRKALGRRVNQGFTLIELVVVMTIIAILAGGITYYAYGQIEKGKRARALADIKELELAIDTYAADNGDPPSTEQGLDALRHKPTIAPVPNNWQGPYVKKAIPNDPWGTPYHYEFPGTQNPDSYDLASYGKDGRPGGTEKDADITNWDETENLR